MGDERIAERGHLFCNLFFPLKKMVELRKRYVLCGLDN